MGCRLSGTLKRLPCLIRNCLGLWFPAGVILEAAKVGGIAAMSSSHSKQLFRRQRLMSVAGVKTQLVAVRREISVYFR
jgi:hypothetical protein